MSVYLALQPDWKQRNLSKVSAANLLVSFFKRSWIKCRSLGAATGPYKVRLTTLLSVFLCTQRDWHRSGIRDVLESVHVRQMGKTWAIVGNIT